MRLIDADKLRNGWLYNGANENIYCANDVIDDIDEQPTVDAVEVVRCKDCVWNKQPQCPLSYTSPISEDGEVNLVQADYTVEEDVTEDTPQAEAQETIDAETGEVK